MTTRQKEKNLYFTVFVYKISIPKQDRVAHEKASNPVYTPPGSTGRL